MACDSIRAVDVELVLFSQRRDGAPHFTERSERPQLEQGRTDEDDQTDICWQIVPEAERCPYAPRRKRLHEGHEGSTAEHPRSSTGAVRAAWRSVASAPTAWPQHNDPCRIALQRRCHPGDTRVLGQ